MNRIQVKLQEDKTIDTNNISNENSNSTTYNNIICDLNSEIPIENINSINIKYDLPEPHSPVNNVYLSLF